MTTITLADAAFAYEERRVTFPFLGVDAAVTYRPAAFTLEWIRWARTAPMHEALAALVTAAELDGRRITRGSASREDWAGTLDRAAGLGYLCAALEAVLRDAPPRALRPMHPAQAC